jgi:hypothetical protein
LQDWVTDVKALGQHAAAIEVVDEVLGLLTVVLAAATPMVDIKLVAKAASMLVAQVNKSGVTPVQPPSTVVMRNPPAPRSEPTPAPAPSKPFWKRK